VLGCDSSAGPRREQAPTPRSPAAAGSEPPVTQAAPSSHAPSAAPSTPSEPPARKRLDVPAPYGHLPVAGYPDAVVSLPRGAESPRPIVVATHGNYDTPEWQCKTWREIVGDRAFILCPRGIARPDSPAPDDIRFTYSNNQELERELSAGLAALQA